MAEMASSVPTLKTLSAKRLAIMICNTQSVKGEIFCLPGSHYALNTAEVPKLKSELHWNAMINSEIANILNNLGLPKGVQQMVTSCCLWVAREIMKWCLPLSFRRRNNLDPKYCAEVINAHLFTWDGRIDKRTAAEELVRDERVPVDHRFNIACSYMLIEDIGHTWGLMTSSERIACHSNCIWTSLTKLWSCYLLGRLQDILGDGNEHNVNSMFWEKALQISVEEENDVAFQFCWNMLEPSVRHELIVYKAINSLSDVYSENTSTFPASYHYRIDADNFCFLYTQMTDDQKHNFFESDMMQRCGSLTLLKLLLDNYWHDVFLEVAGVVWQTSPEPNFSKCLFSILHYVSLKCFTAYELDSRLQYQSLAKKVWSQCPDCVKRAFFENKERLKSWITDLDGDISRFILQDATCEETVNLLFSTKEHQGLILLAFELHGRNLADDYLHRSGLNQSEKQKYLKLEIELLHFQWSQLDTLDRFYDFMHYCLQFEDEVQKQKLMKMHEYERRDEICLALLLAGKWEDVDRFLAQSFSSQEDIVAFKKALFEKSGCDIHYYYFRMDRRQASERCFVWFQLSLDEIKKLKKECAINHPLTVKWFSSLFLEDEEDQSTYDTYYFFKNKRAFYNFVEWHLPNRGQAIKFQEEFVHCVDSIGNVDPAMWKNVVRLLIN